MKRKEVIQTFNGMVRWYRTRYTNPGDQAQEEQSTGQEPMQQHSRGSHGMSWSVTREQKS